MKTLRKFTLVITLVAFYGGLQTVHGQEADEYTIKASFFSKFINFVEGKDASPWPNKSGITNVCLVGTNPFGDKLEKAFNLMDETKTSYQFYYLEQFAKNKPCNILYIGKDQDSHLEEIAQWAAKNQALTVGDSPNFGQKGIIINFFNQSNQVRFEINLKMAAQSGFQISALLLKVAKILEAP